MSKNYHHGDLRNALIIAAAELIEEAGCPDFTISDAAKRAGVSAAAPYRHFRDRDDLLNAVAQLCFIGLADSALQTREQHDLGSRECVIALGLAYIKYVSERPAFYQLMWNERQAIAAATAGDTEAINQPGFTIFLQAVQAWCDRQHFVDVDALDLAVKMWALAHGLAVLNINGKLSLFLPEANVYDMLRSSASTFLDGVERSHQGQ
ncbi:TetR family transcriptional regulator [Seongchinamella sediminis]|uniref:TetR family transcriptional regulator n=1 Tax=Seongchinamella sediminis TaxID=2283635 RepID=A0A3L7E202_9GAMM|nr:TetR/AcrR family transcriptional regulator [Seongchinamella sediminis]RLQ22915.1 TetR family transcriptional regulator [Seongchinamella sediminis]